ncbi:MAG: hypothetical protein Q7V09_17670 [Hydrogenophaga sp.]|uniref:phosphoribosyltransferase-like protein n=1 Tax=Hydrogenophaga sp. TaxID=1904254 RepID=UPI00271A92F7|nr:hypothetical protein [Hydrogenophaga sp.]MDO9032257.1 hypothetical protein [Hydrogenophaga sp.]
MKSRTELLASIAITIQDYRAGEIAQPTPEHVDRWVSQFNAAVQLPLLAEVDHVLDKTYFSRDVVTGFFANQIQNQKIAGADACAFWQNANFLDIQGHGESQSQILRLFNEALVEKCGISVAECGSEQGPFFYLDDVLFSGGRLGSDLRAWVQESAPTKAAVHILVIGTHRFGEWKTLEGLKEAANDAGKDISFSCWAAIRFENRKSYKNKSEVLWPAVLPNDAALAAYMALEERWPFETRAVGGVLENKVFSGEAGRQLIEQELLLAGVKIRAGCQEPKKSMRPLGFSPFGLGFGSTIVTYRNCPNNAPLALWWGDPTATSGAMHWYPLLPRKTYAQSDVLADFDFL